MAIKPGLSRRNSDTKTKLFYLFLIAQICSLFFNVCLILLSLDFLYKRDILSLLEDLKIHMGLDELEQFGLLEQKIESLISLASSLKEEKINLEKKVQAQEEKIDSLTNEIETLKADRDLVRKRIVTLLEKIEEFDL